MKPPFCTVHEALLLTQAVEAAAAEESTEGQSLPPWSSLMFTVQHLPSEGGLMVGSQGMDCSGPSIVSQASTRQEWLEQQVIATEEVQQGPSLNSCWTITVSGAGHPGSSERLQWMYLT